MNSFLSFTNEVTDAALEMLEAAEAVVCSSAERAESVLAALAINPLVSGVVPLLMTHVSRVTATNTTVADQLLGRLSNLASLIDGLHSHSSMADSETSVAASHSMSFESAHPYDQSVTQKWMVRCVMNVKVCVH